MTSDLSRRRFCRLGLGLGLFSTVSVLGLASACSVDDPRIETPQRSVPQQPPGTVPSPAPTPTPTFAGSIEGAEMERRLAGLAAAVLDGPWRSRVGVRKSLLVGIRSGHLEHAAALQGSQPTARPMATPPTKPITPAAAPKSLEVAWAQLVKAELTAAARHRAAALGTTGYSALLWGSLSVAAATYASALTGAQPVPVQKASAHRPMPQLSDVEAMQQLVRQTHAIIWGYQLAIGQLADGPRRTAALGRLRAHRVRLDWLTTTLLTRSAQVPVAEPAYVPSVNPRSDATAAQLIAAMEVALAPFCGLWLAAAATNAERRRALAELSSTVATGRRWGAPVSAWPGWTT